MIEVVVFDLGGVLAQFRPERRLRALAKLGGLTEEVIQKRLFDSGLEARAERGALSPDQTLEAVGEAIEYSGPAERIVEAWSVAFETEPAILAIAKGLQVKAAILTNNGPMMNACLAGPLRELAAPFCDVICSWELATCKPDHRAFTAAAHRLATQPDRLILFDDSIENVTVAREAGWQADRVASLDDLIRVIALYPELALVH